MSTHERDVTIEESPQRPRQAPSNDSVDADGPSFAVRSTVAVSAALQLGAVVAVLVLGALDGGAIGDRLRALPIAAVYGLPAVLALLAIRRRGPLLLAAGVASLILAVFPFSLHSFVYGPVGLVYLLAYPKWPARERGGGRSAAAAGVVPLLLVAAFVALLWHEDPICYTKDASGQVTIDRDPGPITSGTQTMEADSDIVERGCTSDTVVWWEAAVSLTLSTAALAAALYLVRPTRRPSVGADH